MTLNQGSLQREFFPNYHLGSSILIQHLMDSIAYEFGAISVWGQRIVMDMGTSSTVYLFSARALDSGTTDVLELAILRHSDQLSDYFLPGPRDPLRRKRTLSNA